MKRGRAAAPYLVFQTAGFAVVIPPPHNSQLDGKLGKWKITSVKTTFDIPDDLLRTMKMRAVQEGRRFKDVAVEIFRRGLAQPGPSAPPPVRQRVKLPLIQCQHPADPASPLTADQVAQVLLQQEVEWSHETTRR